MPHITTSQALTAHSDPAAILQALKTIRRHDDVPVLILDPATTPASGEEFTAYTEKLLQAYHAVEEDPSNRACSRPNNAADSLRLILNSPAPASYLRAARQTHMPYVFNLHATPEKLWAHQAGPAAYQPMQAALIIGPSPQLDHDIVLAQATGLTRSSPAPLHENRTLWQIACLLHEYAHISGAAEPQADKIAFLTLRQHFPDDHSPYIMTDIRAVTLLKRALLMQFFPPPAQAPFRAYLENYGWAIVQAGDDAARLSAQNPDPATIRHCRFDQYNNDIEILTQLGQIATHYPDLNAASLDNFAHGSAHLAKDITLHTDDPALHEMTARIAQAAHRLTIGAAAYKERARQPFLAPRPL